uniref:Uncharacterized protein n=1 Tax=Cyanoderma ruficeps TaxID=181631 RepID=A0A8C3RG47_9PASS
MSTLCPCWRRLGNFRQVPGSPRVHPPGVLRWQESSTAGSSWFCYPRQMHPQPSPHPLRSHCHRRR